MANTAAYLNDGAHYHCLGSFFRFHRYRLRFAFPIRNSYPTDIPRKVPLNCQSSATLSPPVPVTSMTPKRAHLSPEIRIFAPASASQQKEDKHGNDPAERARQL